MMNCTKVTIALLVLCAIHVCFAKPKWLWVNEDDSEDLELAETLDSKGRGFENVKRKVFRGGSCGVCPTGNCYGGKCVAG